MPKMVFAIKDTHVHPAGRNRAQAMLQSGGIGVFFIEWPTPINPAAVIASFAGIAAGDAAPTLITLTQIALGLGIPVVPCDLTAAATVAALNALNDGYGPYGLASAFQPWGKGIRDRHASGIIVNHMQMSANANLRGLVMFGADHFVAEAGRNAPPLHKLISRRGWLDCFIVDNHSAAVNF